MSAVTWSTAVSVECTLLAELPLSSLEPLQRVQNAVARLVFQLNSRELIIPSLLQLYWLPVRWRVQFKLCVIMHRVHNGRAPACLDDAVQPVNRRTVRPGLRSENSQNYYVPRVRTKLGERTFSYAGPVV